MGETVGWGSTSERRGRKREAETKILWGSEGRVRAG